MSRLQIPSARSHRPSCVKATRFVPPGRVPASRMPLRRLAALLVLLAALPLLTGFTLPGQVQRLWRQADRAFGRKQYARATDLYLQARRARPDDWNLMYNAAVAKAAAGQYDDAVADFKQIAAQGPQQLREMAEYNAGNCFLAQQKGKEAVEHYKRALYLKPDDLNAKWNLELARRQQKQQQKQQQPQQNKQQGKQQQKQKQKQPQGEQQKQKQQQQQQQQQQQRQQMSQEQARRLLQSLSQQDRDLQKKVSRYRNERRGDSRPEKDW